jgi:2,3-bisphosphoglycerate-independent phosphoglycerate mutase
VRGPVCLVILDGFGLGDRGPGDAIAAARTPFFDRCNRVYPRAQLLTSGGAVGLPEGQMGNSEVGHMTLGAGRIIELDLVRIARALEDGTAARGDAFQALLRAAERSDRKLHLLGLVSNGGVHSAIGHLQQLLEWLAAHRIAPVLHAFTDGRDTPPRSALEWIAPLESRIRAAGGSIATVAGRYYAMDRDARWERVSRAYRALVLGEGTSAASAVEAVEKAYGRGESDEFIEPAVILGGTRLAPGAAALFFNFRADRARELTNALTRQRPELLGTEVTSLPPARPGTFATMTVYDEAFELPVLFPPIDLRGGLGELVSRAGLRQLRIAETEKYAHVTYFFNGGLEEPYAGEDRVLIPSPRDVPTYDQKPEMSARELTQALLEALEQQNYAFVLLNFANPDMVGHTGVLAAGVKAVETVDACLERLSRAVLAHGGALLITADHGNVEQLLDPQTGGPHTAHTTNPVPIWWISEPPRGRLIDGGLADVAPTLCALLGLAPSAEMTGTCLLEPAPPYSSF